jgi:hypothetical protein
LATSTLAVTKYLALTVRQLIFWLHVEGIAFELCCFRRFWKT